MTIPSSRSLILWISVFSITSPSADFGRLQKTSDFFRNLQKWSCRLQKSQHSQDKNLTLISQKKLAGIAMQKKSNSSLTQGSKAELSAFGPWQTNAFYSAGNWSFSFNLRKCFCCWYKLYIIYGSFYILQYVNWRQRRMIVSGMPCFPCCKT